MRRHVPDRMLPLGVGKMSVSSELSLASEQPNHSWKDLVKTDWQVSVLEAIFSFFAEVEITRNM